MRTANDMLLDSLVEQSSMLSDEELVEKYNLIAYGVPKSKMISHHGINQVISERIYKYFQEHVNKVKSEVKWYRFFERRKRIKSWKYEGCLPYRMN
jgi:hypothetical protein